MTERDWIPIKYIDQCEHTSCVVVRRASHFRAGYAIGIAYKTVTGVWVADNGPGRVIDYAEFYVLPPDPPFTMERER